MAASSLQVTSYTIGWVAALHHERAAALELLDEEHAAPEDFHKNAADTNSYSWGHMGKHNIVIASLPSGEYGTAAAADTAAGMRSSLPHIRIGLLVGIGAGVTGESTDKDGKLTVKRQIFLGDVVVSNPSDANGGVVQHDVKKVKIVDGEKTYQLNGFLDAPPRALRAPLGSLRAHHERRDSKIKDLLEVFKKNKKMRKPYGYPGADEDPVRKALRQQAENADTELSDDEGVRDSPEIHYGTIASGDELIKEAGERDDIVTWLQKDNIDPVCFEMEARGLMNSFPCLVVRGICDYADERKNDIWQRYAAATAAAFAKEFLEYVDVQEVSAARPIGDLIERVHEKVDNLSDRLDVMHMNIGDKDAAEEKQKILDFLTIDDHSEAFNAGMRQHLTGTSNWFLERTDFTSWISSEQSSFLYCTGAQGAGKTVLAARIIKHLRQQLDHNHAVLYLFCDYGKREAQTFEQLLASLLRQISNYSPTIPIVVHKMYEKYDQTQQRPTMQDLSVALKSTFKEMGHITKTYIIVDALDECKISTCEMLVKTMGDLAKDHNLHCLATSRIVPNIRKLFSTVPHVHIRATHSDIEAYVRFQLGHIRARVNLDQRLEARIVENVLNVTDRLFLLARLHMESLASKTSVRDIEDTLAILPSGYSGAYDSAMDRILSQDKELSVLATSVLTWVVNARRPLLIEELQHALAVRTDDRMFIRTGVVASDLLLSVCAGLLVEREEMTQTFAANRCGLVTVRFAHFTVQEYFVETRKKWFPGSDLIICKTCISYITFDKFNEVVPSNNVAIGRLLCFHRLSSYANTHWPSHAAEVEKEGSDEDIECLRDVILQTFREGAILFGWAQLTRPQATIWHCLAQQGLTRLFVSLAKHTNYVAKPDRHGRLPLAWAARSGNDSFLQTLMESGLDKIDVCDDKGRTPFWWAVKYGHTKVAKILLEADVTLASRADQNGLAPLSLAVNILQRNMVELMCAVDGVDMNCTDTEGNTPLIVAARHGDLHLVKILLNSRRANVNVRGGDGETPLSRAAMDGHLPLVEVFLNARGIDVAMKSSWGATPLLHALWSGRFAVIRRLLLEVDISLPETKSTKEFDLNYHAEEWAGIQMGLSGHTAWSRDAYLRQNLDVSRHSVWITYLYWTVRQRVEEGTPSMESMTSASSDSSREYVEAAVPALVDESTRLGGLTDREARQILRYLAQEVYCHLCKRVLFTGGLHCPECKADERKMFQANVCYECVIHKKVWCGATPAHAHALQDYLCFLQTGKLPIPRRVFKPDPDREWGSVSNLHGYSFAQPGRHMACDFCHASITRGLHCAVCHSDDFDLCLNCARRARWCKDITHRLQEYGEDEVPRNTYPWRSYTQATRRRASIGASLTWRYDLMNISSRCHHTTFCLSRSGYCYCIRDRSGVSMKQREAAPAQIRTPWKLLAPRERGMDEG